MEQKVIKEDERLAELMEQWDKAHHDMINRNREGSQKVFQMQKEITRDIENVVSVSSTLLLETLFP